MALSFLISPMPRTTIAASNPIITDSGRTKVFFLPHTSPYAFEVHVPPGPTIHQPPYHWHMEQDEHFRVKAGSARFLLDGATKVVDGTQTPGTIKVPRGAYHTFTNASKAETLVMDVGMDPAQRARDEAFFRNIYGYADDCNSQGRSPNVCQLMLFLWMFDCMVALPGPKVVVKPLSKVLVFVLGVVVGKWTFGFKESYEEYYKPRSE